MKTNKEDSESKKNKRSKSTKKEKKISIAKDQEAKKENKNRIINTD
jgi:hypothetical protein